MNLFIRHELFLYGEVIAKTYSQKATELVDSLFAHRVNVPEDIRNKRVGQGLPLDVQLLYALSPRHPRLHLPLPQPQGYQP